MSRPSPFSMLTDAITTPQIDCSHHPDDAGTHNLIRANLHRSAMYSGSHREPRAALLPSIEDKIVRFADRDSHQIFSSRRG
jgi:tRNA uridine 5-carboxymethylaminomethyl modification enzyme